MIDNLRFGVSKGKLSVQGLPPGLDVRGINYTSPTLGELKHLSIASANIAAAKFYIDTLKTFTAEVDPHLLDAALLAAITKYGSVFKADKRGRYIDPRKIFKPQVLVVNRSISDAPIVFDDPGLDLLKSHEFFIAIRDQVIAHDDRIIGNTECFAALDGQLHCEHVIALTQRSTVYSAIKPERDNLPLCIDAVFTWLSTEKEKYCQLVTDEINGLKLKVRRKFPEPLFEAYKGFVDASERLKRTEPYWQYNWETGEKGLVDQVVDVENK